MSDATNRSLPPVGLLIIGDEVLSGKRQDKHLAQANALLRPKGFALSWVRILGDEPQRLTATLKETFASGDVVFSFGGIGATPDDRTRQCAADALGRPIERHPEAVAEIEAQFGEDAYPNRVKMAEYPQGASIIPNPYNRVPGFSVADHHFMPGFPMMAKGMMQWVLETYYQAYQTTPTVERSLRLIHGHESEWIDFMEAFEARFPELRLFSLPSIRPDGTRHIELGVEGQPELAEKGFEALVNEVRARQADYELSSESLS
ncbi:molybdopterin-binding protein [Thiomicrospira sp. WB1]|uniref:competence/damage-inducible protein A n=1 Tax=Thiomicrospira sp. WB1 TaxID=1685380 RepID=UPI000747A010|nr:competence/damage-inducible protein A [Thiomicrospira sp. WB1]KUJ71244.1 molybdopterin-binding protein [Thiomicrospira sp. WB1]